MSSSLALLQAAIHGLLASASPLTSQLAEGTNSIFDHVPADSAFPYMVLGDMTERPVETQEGGGKDIALTVHCYSRYRGFHETQQILATIADVLDGADYPVAGHTLVLCDLTSSSCLLEADGTTRHGIQNFRIVIDPA